MALAVLYGAGSGALHAVTGPDHVLSLGPAALEQRRASWRIGLHWGIGHSLGTLLLAVPALLLAQLLRLQALAAWGDRVAGVVLMVTAILSWCSQRSADAHAHAPGPRRDALLVGFFHGITGAGSLVLVLPVLVASSLLRSVAFLTAFSLGSTLAMALLTWSIANLAGALPSSTIHKARGALTLASLALGTAWLLL